MIRAKLPAMERLRTNLKNELEKRQISQSEICRELGMSRPQFNAFLQKRSTAIGLETAERLAEFLNLDVVDLLRHPE